MKIHAKNLCFALLAAVILLNFSVPVFAAESEQSDTSQNPCEYTQAGQTFTSEAQTASPDYIVPQDPGPGGPLYLTYGGLVSYKDKGGNTYHEDLYLDFDDSYYFVLSRSKITIGEVVKQILTYIPDIGAIFSTLFFVETLVNQDECKAIQDADGYAHIANSTLTTPYGDEYSNSLVKGWDSYPTVTIDVNTVSEFCATPFQEYNPFEHD